MSGVKGGASPRRAGDRQRPRQSDRLRAVLGNGCRKPDIAGYVESNLGNVIFTAEVKRGSLTIQDIYQAKMYKELFGATFGFLIGTEPVTEELKRLLRAIPIILMSAGDYTFHFLAIARFDLDSGTFVDWFLNLQPDTDPFTHLKRLSF